MADAENPGAWEPAIRVPPSRSPRPLWYGQSKHLELAAKFYVLSVLHRLGAEANLTYAQPDNVDIAAVRESGEALTIDVKTLTGTSQWPVENFSAKKHHFMVFVCFALEWDAPQLVPDLYIWSSERLKAFITRKNATTVSLEALALELDPTSAWKQFLTRPLA
ncbi:MAG: hypothetical protein ACRD9S_20985 [Pyrinomonadaceae bacterium]